MPNYSGYKENLNLTYAVRDGIVCHCGEVNENYLKPRDEYIDLELIEKGNIDEIVNQNGKTYNLSKIYEFINDCLLKRGRLIEIQHQNKLAYIDDLCEENAKN